MKSDRWDPSEMSWETVFTCKHTQTHTWTRRRHTHDDMIWGKRALTQHTRGDCRKSSNKGVKTSSIVSVGWGYSGSVLRRSVFIARSFCRHSSHYIHPHPAVGMRENPAVPSPNPAGHTVRNPRDYSPPDERGAITPFIPNEKPLFSVRFGVTCRASNGKCAAARRARVCVSDTGVFVTETKRRLYYSKHTNEGTDLLPHFRHT